MKTRDSIVVTGLGAVSPLGVNVESTWQNLLAGKSGIATIQSFDASHFSTRIAAEVKGFNPAIIKDSKIVKRTLPHSQYAIAAADEALADAGLQPQAATATRWGMVLGSGMMSSEQKYWDDFRTDFAPKGEVDYHAMGQGQENFLISQFVRTQSNVSLGILLQRYQIKGYATAVHTACASGGQALGLALQALRRGDADYMLAGGFDSMISPIGLSSFILLGALSTYNDTPHTASRPFDLTRNGFVLGEGAAFLVLERRSHAKQRGAKIYAEFSGEGNSLSSYRITDSHPSGDGAIQAIAGALRDADLPREAIDYINAHGTSTKMNDLSETNALKHVFGSGVNDIAVSSTKGQTGHLIAAAGALEAVISVLAIHHQTVPMSANLNTPDPDCNLNYVTGCPVARRICAALSNSFGFGGSNSCLVFQHPEQRP